jgi:hypothetical protein
VLLIMQLVGFGDGGWPANFHGWAINGAISTLTLWTASTPTGASLASPLASPGANDIVATGAVATTVASNMNANGFVNATVVLSNRTTNPTTIMASFNSSTTHVKGFHSMTNSNASAANNGITW